MTKALRLKAVEYVDFRRSDLRLWEEFRSGKTFRGELRNNEAYVLVSISRTQVMFVMRCDEFEFRGHRRKVLHTIRLRLKGGTWSPDMLEDYAQRAGLHFVGLKSFTQRFNEHMAERYESYAALLH